MNSVKEILTPLLSYSQTIIDRYTNFCASSKKLVKLWLNMPVAFRSAWQISNLKNHWVQVIFQWSSKQTKTEINKQTENPFDRQKLLSILNFTEELNKPGFVGCSASYVTSITVFVLVNAVFSHLFINKFIANIMTFRADFIFELEI